MFQGANENAAPADRSGIAIFGPLQGSAAFEVIRSGDKAQAGSRDSAGLARHGVGEALTFQNRGQVGLAAGEEAGEKLHDNLHSVAQTGRLRLMEWGWLVGGGDIGAFGRGQNRKCEAVDMKSDIGCAIRGRQVQKFTNIYKELIAACQRHAACSYAPCTGCMAGKHV